MNLYNIKIKAKNLKCFGDTCMGFEKICPINVIIGKNNSGKSTLLQLIEFAIKRNLDLGSLSHKENLPIIYLELPIEKENISRVFSITSAGGPIPGNHGAYGNTLLGKSIFLEISQKSAQLEYSFHLNGHLMTDIEPDERARRGKSLSESFSNPFSAKVYRKLSSERDIFKEDFKSISMDQEVLADTGEGATNLIANFLHNRALSEEKVEKDLLDALNKIYGDDGIFNRILAQRDPGSGKYEIYLLQERKGARIPLSESGSSLKTVLLILLNTILVPAFKQKNLKHFIFAFEEIENNLHPSLQRRLLMYLINLVREAECSLFLTTHSNVMIDIFSHQKDVQIVHVKHDGESSTVEQVSTYIDQCGVLNDLDFRASDVLQANGVIWVEGPSDRIYLKKWIELWSDNELQEDVHFQFVFYGGSIRRHLSAGVPEEVESTISIFRINRNAVIVMDSDKSAEKERLEPSKKRLIEEVKDIRTSFSFVTGGRDIENYINPEIIKNYLKLDKVPRKVGQYENFEDYLDEIKEGGRKSFKKVLFAERVKSEFKKDDLVKMLDLDEKMTKLVRLIKKWNKLI